ncbi:hypothetical protein CPB84DRAFT_1677885 [Gymnopilus junonius]|uniref:F-box domain-containing protein n=1 Tax=Gymnopilus junonius TaxID=109634 RepID=A0A9P5NR53_GYMJU|nr:hypothetical protein CPB84DRAFT_1677885 [Gymnopilus junonius]
MFWTVIHRVVDKAGNVVELEESGSSNTSSTSNLHDDAEEGCEVFGNFFLSEGCFHYLEAWLDFSSLPKTQHDQYLSFAGELYEVLNSREEGRVHGVGILPYIDYDGIENTMEQYQEQIADNLIIPKYTSASIRKKESSEKILESIIRDCRSWMFCAPDMWPIANNDFPLNYTLSTFPLAAAASDMLALLPSDILLEIVQISDTLVTYFALARTSKWLYNALTDPLLLNRNLRAMANSPSGCLFWVKPVNSMTGELKKGYNAVSTFLLNVGTGTDIGMVSKEVTTLVPFDHIDFPWYYFVQRCFESDSMMNRKRIWGQVKQFENVWRDYRENGWEVDRFSVPLV